MPPEPLSRLSAVIEDAERHPWTLGCRTCQERAEREVERLQGHIAALPYESEYELAQEIKRRSLDTDTETRADLVEAVKREWGGSGVDSREPYLTNGASRAVYAVLAELDRRTSHAAT